MQTLYVATVNDTYTAQTRQPPYSSISEVMADRMLPRNSQMKCNIWSARH